MINRRASASNTPAHARAWWRSFALLGCCVLAPLLTANSLVDKSPFLPPDFQAPGSTPETAPPTQTTAPTNLELKGIFQIAGEYRFNIYDRQAQRGAWVRQDDDQSGYRVVDYNRANRSIQVEIAGQRISLTLQSPSDNPMGVAVTVPNNNPQVGPPPPPETRRRVVVPPRRVVRPSDGSGATRRSRRPPQERQSNNR